MSEIHKTFPRAWQFVEHRVSFHGAAFGEKQERIGKVQRTVDLKNADEVTRAGAGSAEEGMGKAQELDANQNIRDDWWLEL